jgi:plastocyanin
MKTTMLLTIMTIGAGLAFGVIAQAGEKKHEEESVSASDVPAAVQQAAETEAKGGKIVRWEKEGKNYEAVIEKDGKQWGVEINASGKVLNEHDEKGEKH